MYMRRRLSVQRHYGPVPDGRTRGVALKPPVWFVDAACKEHLTTKYGAPTTPAMAAGVARYPWSVTPIAALLD